jgi:hypothetical protein
MRTLGGQNELRLSGPSVSFHAHTAPRNARIRILPAGSTAAQASRPGRVPGAARTGSQTAPGA